MKLCNQTIWDNTDLFTSNFLLVCKPKRSMCVSRRERIGNDTAMNGNRR